MKKGQLNKRKYPLWLLLFVISSLSLSFTNEYSVHTESDILGYWYFKKITVKMYKAKNGKYYGKIVDLVNKDNLQKLTPETALIMRNFEYKGGNEWENGTIFVSSFVNDHLPATIKLTDNKVIEITACKGFLCKTVDWERVDFKK